jgi:2-phosphosulfolactate phosphatase
VTKVVISAYEDTLPEASGAIVAVDVLRATTTAVTAVALGRRCFPVATLDEAVELSRELDGALLGGELGGHMPYGFELTNSPVAITGRSDVERPLILLSSSGTRLLRHAHAVADTVYVTSLRNVGASADAVAAARAPVAIVAAATRGEFREEDQFCCARIAARLADDGFELADADTAELVERWHGRPVAEITVSKSVAYLADTDQLHDLEFVLEHVDDLRLSFRMDRGEVVRA